MFLPDRFIRGECPRCGSADQYGDSCEVCGATYLPTEMKNPVSVLSGVAPVERESEHFFFKLADFDAMLRTWIRGGHLQSGVVNKLDEWFEAGLQDWDISRDSPYFGFEIPDAPGKYFYVWLDAPVGYFASLKNLSARSDVDFETYTARDSTAEMYHFIGKDIVYFHSLFWPAMLAGSGFRTPTAIYAHGFLTVDGQKMSKSRGTFITARTYLQHLDPEYLRYYFAAKLGPGLDDIDLNLDDFIQRVNADVVGKLVNIASRSAGFISKRFHGWLGPAMTDQALFDEFAGSGDDIAAAYEGREYGRAIRLVMGLADRANQYVDDRKPWLVAKEESRNAELQTICTTALNLFKVLMVYLKPVLPRVAADVETLFAIEPMQWAEHGAPLLDHRMNRFKPLIRRIESAQVDAMIEASKETLATQKSDSEAGAPREPQSEEEPLEPRIRIEDFAKVDLRIAVIKSAAPVAGADKLLELELDLGGQERRVFAGIKQAYQPADLIGRHVVVVANLEPRKMRFGVSEGMILAAGPGGADIWVLSPDVGARPGMRVK